MKTLLILFHGNSTKSPAPGPLGYEGLYTYFKKNNITLCRSSVAYYNVKQNSFEKAQFFIDGEWVWKNEITPSVILDKTPFYITKDEMDTRMIISQNFPFYNNLKLSEIMSDKSLTYAEFKDFSAETMLIKNPSEISKLHTLESPKFIVKPLSQSGGKGIFISEKESLLENITENSTFPILVQKFIDSSHAHNSFVDGYNDIRVIIRDNTPFYAFMRTPKKGAEIANVAQGGHVEIIPIENLMSDESVKGFVEKIMKRVDDLDPSHKLYAIDFMFDNDDNIWLIEMNSRPGLILEESERIYQEKFYENLLTFFR